MSLTFKKISSPDPLAKYLADTISTELHAGKRVLWLLAGGSAIPVAVQAAGQLVAFGVPLEKLVVTLTDERHGVVGHANSNWKQLEDAGFSLPGAELHPVVTGKDLAGTVADFEAFLAKELSAAQYRLGLFGIGPDGHTSGILPHSSATRESRLAHGYDGGEHQRVTTTAVAIARLDEAVVYAVGEAKWPVLERLMTDVPVDEQPAQVLKRVSKTTVFTDMDRT